VMNRIRARRRRSRLLMITIWRIRGVMVERMIEIMDGRKIRLSILDD